MDKVFTFLAIFFAVVSPTCLIPIAYKTRSNGTFLLASIPAIKLVADFSAILSNGNNCSLEIVYISAILFKILALYNCTIVSPPKLSMFMAFRETKCSIFPFTCGGHSKSFGQK